MTTTLLESLRASVAVLGDPSDPCEVQVGKVLVRGPRVDVAAFFENQLRLENIERFALRHEPRPAPLCRFGPGGDFTQDYTPEVGR